MRSKLNGEPAANVAKQIIETQGFVGFFLGGRVVVVIENTV